MRVGVLTYQCAHRKTYDTLALLKAQGYYDVHVYATPLTYEKKFFPIYQHRPQLPNPLLTGIEYNPKIICSNFEYAYSEIKQYSEIKDESIDAFLVCGAGILPESFVKSQVIVNSHPGYIPIVRGLDALKWAIIEGLPIGVTSHLIGDEVDAGSVIQRIEIPVYTNDTFFALAQRQYEYEICLLVGALERLNDPMKEYPAGENVQHRRMPKEVEAGLLRSFEEYKKKHAINAIS